MEDKKRREIKEERTAASKLFENEDHSFTKEIYLDDVHYQDEEGIWQEMDDTLTEEMDEDTEADQEENMAEEYAASERAEKDFANRKSYFVSIPESRGRYLLPKMHIRLAGHWKTQKK